MLYKVSLTIDLEFEVDADDEDEARKLAYEEWEENTWEADVDVYDVELIQKDEEEQEEVIGHYPIQEIGKLAFDRTFVDEYPDGYYVFQEGGAWMAVVHRGMGAMLSHHTTKQEAIEWLKSHYKEVK